MGYEAGSGILKKRTAGKLVRAGYRLHLLLLCLASSFLLTFPAEAQSWDSGPTRNNLLTAIADSFSSQDCCIDQTVDFSEDPQYPSAGSTVHSTPDLDGLKRDTWYFMGAQLVSLAVIYTLPEDVSGWSDEQKENFSLSKWKENVSEPRIDEDDFVINYVLHPYWGAAYYVRARERGYGKLNSFWYSLFLSTFYEAGPEALFEQPSIQDLIVTPVFGAWLGEYFMDLRSAVRARTAVRGYRSRRDNWLWYLTDPLDLVNSGVNRLFGPQAEFSFTPLIGAVEQNRGTGIARPNHDFPVLALQERSLLTGLGNEERQRFAGIRFTISW